MLCAVQSGAARRAAVLLCALLSVVRCAGAPLAGAPCDAAQLHGRHAACAARTPGAVRRAAAALVPCTGAVLRADVKHLGSAWRTPHRCCAACCVLRADWVGQRSWPSGSKQHSRTLRRLRCCCPVCPCPSVQQRSSAGVVLRARRSKGTRREAPLWGWALQVLLCADVC